MLRTYLARRCQQLGEYPVLHAYALKSKPLQGREMGQRIDFKTEERAFCS